MLWMHIEIFQIFQKQIHIFETVWLWEIYLIFSKIPKSHHFRIIFKLNENLFFLSFTGWSCRAMPCHGCTCHVRHCQNHVAPRKSMVCPVLCVSCQVFNPLVQFRGNILFRIWTHWDHVEVTGFWLTGTFWKTYLGFLTYWDYLQNVFGIGTYQNLGPSGTI